MSAPFPNLYTHRRVAEAAARACDVCYKPSSSVLITPDQRVGINVQDFFYICPVHLKDRYFCTPKVDEDAAKAAREKELAEEKERLMKEYQERQEKKAKKDKEKEKEKEKDKEKGKEKDAAEGKDAEKKETSSGSAKDEDKPQKEDDDKSPAQEEPRVFELKSSFYQQRLLRKRQAEAAKRDRERTSQPNYFPSVPSEPPKR